LRGKGQRRGERIERKAEMREGHRSRETKKRKTEMRGKGQRSGERTERKADMTREGEKWREDGEKDRYERRRTERWNYGVHGIPGTRKSVCFFHFRQFRIPCRIA